MKNENYLIVAGLIGVAAAVSLSFIFSNNWVGYFAAVAVGIIFLVILNRWVSINIESTGIKKTIRYVLGFLVILHLYLSVFDYLRSNRQQKTLIETRRSIDGSIAQIGAEQVLIKTLRHYYQSADPELRTIEASFLEVAEDQLLDDMSFIPNEPGAAKSLKYKAEMAAPDSIVIRVQSTIAKGNDELFSNFDSEAGKYQAVAILTPNGVSYVREN